MGGKKYIPFYIPDIGSEEINAVGKAVSHGSISGNGIFGRRLENLLCKITGARYALFTTSCTSAIEMALSVLDIGRGDEVILPSFSFVSIANAIIKTGAELQFVDVDEETLNVTPEIFKRAVSRRTKVVIPVHYGGHSCDMDGINRIARYYGIKVVEDAAQAIGSFYRGRHLGTIGDIGCISFHGTKNITCGEGGAFLTNNRYLAKMADIVREKGTNRSLFLKGKIDKYRWISTGSSYVQSDILAAIAIEQLKKLKYIVERRTESAEFLNRHLAKYKSLIRFPRIVKGAKTNWHIYAILFHNKTKRDIFIKRMGEKGVECTTHFIPLHLSPFAKKYLGYKRGQFPITEKICDTLARIPIYPRLTKNDMKYIVSCMDDVLKDI